jgi:RNA polymerase sigma-70 factor (ECF subfamily)
MNPIADVFARTFGEESGPVLASLTGYLGDLDLAEDVFQEARVIARERWPRGSRASTRCRRLSPAALR